MSADGGGHVADPITTTRMVTGLKRAYPLTRQALDGEAKEEEVELSLGLSIGGGGSKGKAAGDGFLNGSSPPVIGSVGRCQARLQAAEIRTRNPVALPAMPKCLPGPLNGYGFASMFARRAPRVFSGSGQSRLNPLAPRCRSLQPLANPSVSLNHCTNPQGYANSNGAKEMSGKRMRRTPSFSGSSAGGRCIEFSQSNWNQNTDVQEAMAKPSTPPAAVQMRSRLDEMPSVMTRGIDGRRVSGVLYRYNNQTEIRIVCICHGSSFTPAEFVRHAGGVESSHPLKQIVVVPSQSVLALAGGSLL